MEKTRQTQLDNSIRALMCLKFDQGESKKMISEELRIKYTTVSSVIDLYLKTGRVEKIKNRARKKTKLSPEDKKAILDYLKEDCSIDLKEIQTRITSERQVTVSTSTISRVFKEFHYSMKRVELVPVRRNIKRNVDIRHDYALQFIRFAERPIVFLDEMGVQFTMRRKYGRAPVGTTPRKTIVSIRSRNVSVSAAMTRNELYSFATSQVPYNAERYGAFLDILLEKLAANDIHDAVLIMDNCPFHKKEQLRTKIEEQGHTLCFLPPYSPQLNPIEEVFSKWKALLRAKNCKDQDELLNSLDTCSAQITPANCRSYYQHMKEFLDKAVRKEDF